MTSPRSLPWTGIRARSVTAFYYHGLYARDGSATHPDVITDTALVFALRAALLGAPAVLRAQPDYKTDIASLPWRASLLLGEGNSVMAPLRHTIDVVREGGNQENMQGNMFSGNFKNTFFVHEVEAGAEYTALLVGPNPFIMLGTNRFVIRVGVGRLGMLELTPDDAMRTVALNAATAKLFRRIVPEAYRIIDTIRVGIAMPIAEAVAELEQWYEV
jgi:hypothetical protein